MNEVKGTTECFCGCGRILFFRMSGKNIKPDDRPVVFATHECWKRGPSRGRRGGGE